MSHDLYRDVYLQIRARTCATVSEAEDATDAVIARLMDEIKLLRAERDRLKAALEAKQTDPASAVCVWTRTPYTAMYSSTCCDENYLHKVTASGMCHRCDKPIKFTEAKE